MTRRSLAWIDFGISASSSRNNVPPFAASRRPGLSRTAPVNAPLRCPNISDSSRPSGSAAQLIATNGRRSEEHTSELQSQSNLVCRLLLEKKKKKKESYELVRHI